MRTGRNGLIALALLVLGGAALAAVVTALLVSHRAGAGFAWFAPGPVPGGWRQARLPGRLAVLAYPASLRRLPGDAGSVTAGLASPQGQVLVYLNATPRQGAETLGDWAGFRLEHLREDGDQAVRLVARSPLLRFRGGIGRCLIDDYTTKAGHNRYREIACFVSGAGRASVLVAATPAADWARYGGLLQRAVDAYAAR